MASTSWDRRGEARAALRAVVSDPDYGVAALSSPQVLSGLLKDLLPDAPREAAVLVAAAEARLADLLAGHRAQGMDAGTACALAEQTLAARTAFTPEACNWVVRELAAAAGFDTEGAVLGAAPADSPRADGLPAAPLAAAASPSAAAAPPGAARAGTAPSGTELPRGWQQTMTAAGVAADLGRNRVSGRRKALKVLAAGAVAAAVAAVALIWYSAAHPPHADVYAGGRYGFTNPRSIAIGGGHVWVVNGGNGKDGSVTELDASDGRWVQTLSGGERGINGPAAITAAGTDVWVANYSSNSVTELDAGSGRWVRTLSGGSYGFYEPDAIAVGGGHVWVGSGGSVTELDASSGRWVRTLSGRSYGFDGPSGIVVDGGHVWVSNYFRYGGRGGSVTELDASSGRWVATLSNSLYGFNATEAIAVGGGHLWVANEGSGSVTELNASSGRWVATLSGRGYGFNGGPDAIAVGGGHVWVANVNSTGGLGSVTELDASTGHLTRIWSGYGYRLSNPAARSAFDNPAALFIDGASLWVANSNAGSIPGGSVTKVPAR